jgi:hypothetical protein
MATGIKTEYLLCADVISTHCQGFPHWHSSRSEHMDPSHMKVELCRIPFTQDYENGDDDNSFLRARTTVALPPHRLDRWLGRHQSRNRVTNRILPAGLRLESWPYSP